MTSAERREWALKVKSLRQGLGMTQADLAKAAGVTRQTVNNMEGGTTPQAESLGRVLAVVGIEVDPAGFEPETERWLQMIGTLIETVPAAGRPAAVSEVIVVLGHAISRPAAPVTPIGVGRAQHTDDFAEEQYAADQANQDPDEDLRIP